MATSTASVAMPTRETERERANAPPPLAVRSPEGDILPIHESSSSSSAPSVLTSNPSRPTDTSSLTTTTNDSLTPSPEAEANARLALLSTMDSLSQAHLRPIQVKARDIASASESLSTQSAQLDSATSTFHATLDDMEALLDGARDELKEMGDLQNWAEVLELELQCLEETARLADEEKGERRDVVVLNGERRKKWFDLW